MRVWCNGSTLVYKHTRGAQLERGSNPQLAQKIIVMKNYWKIKGLCYWEKEISKDEDGNIWINVGWHLPLSTCKTYTIKKVLAVSAYVYASKFS